MDGEGEAGLGWSGGGNKERTGREVRGVEELNALQNATRQEAPLSDGSLIASNTSNKN